MENFAVAAFFSVATVCVTFLIWDARRRKAVRHDLDGSDGSE